MADPSNNGQPNPNGEVEAPNLLAGIRTGSWLDAQIFDPLQYAIDPILPEGFVLLVGAPKIGKSWFVLELALGCAYGGRALGMPASPRHVFHLALEDGDRRMQDRCRKLLDSAPIPPNFTYLTTVAPGAVIPTIETWLLTVPTDQPPLVILDTLGKVMPPAHPGETTYGRDYRVGGAIRSLVANRVPATIVVCHHDRKAQSDDFVDSVSGSHGLAGAADTLLVLTRPRHMQSGLLKVTGRDVAEGEYALSFTGSRWNLDGNTPHEAMAKAEAIRDTDQLGDTAADVLAYLSGTTPARPADVAKHLDIDPIKAANILGRLVKTGRARRVGRGMYLAMPSKPHRNDGPGQTEAWPTGSVGADAWGDN